MAADDFDFIEDVGLRADLFAFVADHGPELPATQTLAVPQMEEGVEIIVRDHVLLSRFAEDGEQDKENLVAEKAVLEMTVEGQDGGVVLAWVGRALLEIEREETETVAGGLE